MIEINEKKDCCGCSACFNICPHKAIEMKIDEKGFEIPKVLNKKCTHCDACKKVCPIKNANDVSILSVSKSIAAINKNDEDRKASSSGGIFTILANEIFKRDGVVFGAMFDENFNVVHDYIEKSEEIFKIRGSKYVQSKIGNSYTIAKKFLEKGKIVLFTGTPCQIAGLISFLGKQYPNLYIQDIICHGVPSPKVWMKYIEYRESLDKELPKYISFRDKKYGWKLFGMKFKYGTKEYIKDINHDIYLRMFLKNLSLRESCYNCKFKNSRKVIADITLGDFWGIDDVLPEFSDNNGTSAVILNTEKGANIFEAVIDKIVSKEVNINDIVKHNSALMKSVELPKNRENFFSDLDKMDFEKLAKKYLKKPSFIRKVASKIKRKLLK